MNISIVLLIIAQALDWFSLLVIVYILMTWIPSIMRSPVGIFLSNIVEPALYPFRKLIPIIYGLDLAPLALIISLEILNSILLSLVLS